MKITCNRNELVTALTRARGVSATRTTMPILTCCLLRRVGAGHLQIAATDIELGYTASIPAKCDGDDLVAVNTSDLLDRVKAMPDGEVKLDATAKAVIVTAKGTKRRFERAAQDGDSFPKLPTMAEGVGFSIECAALAAMIEAVHFAVDEDSTQAKGNLFVHWEPGRVVMAATDGRRISVEERKADVTTKGETLIPKRGVAELRKLLDAGDKVSVVATEPQTFFDFGDFGLSIARPALTFPTYQNFPAKRIESPLRLPVAPMLDALAAVSLSATRGDLSSNLTLFWRGGELVLCGESSERGVATDVVPGEWSGPDFETRFNPIFMREALVASGAEFVALSLDPGDDLWPIHIEPWDAQSGRKHFGAVMPTRKT